MLGVRDIVWLFDSDVVTESDTDCSLDVVRDDDRVTLCHSDKEDDLLITSCVLLALAVPLCEVLSDSVNVWLPLLKVEVGSSDFVRVGMGVAICVIVALSVNSSVPLAEGKLLSVGVGNDLDSEGATRNLAMYDGLTDVESVIDLEALFGSCELVLVVDGVEDNVLERNPVGVDEFVTLPDSLVTVRLSTVLVNSSLNEIESEVVIDSENDCDALDDFDHDPDCSVVSDTDDEGEPLCEYDREDSVDWLKVAEVDCEELRLLEAERSTVNEADKEMLRDISLDSENDGVDEFDADNVTELLPEDVFEAESDTECERCSE